MVIKCVIGYGRFFKDGFFYWFNIKVINVDGKECCEFFFCLFLVFFFLYEKDKLVVELIFICSFCFGIKE